MSTVFQLCNKYGTTLDKVVEFYDGELKRSTARGWFKTRPTLLEAVIIHAAQELVKCASQHETKQAAGNANDVDLAGTRTKKRPSA